MKMKTLERYRGLEPLPTVWKTVMLPITPVPHIASAGRRVLHLRYHIADLDKMVRREPFRPRCVMSPLGHFKERCGESCSKRKNLLEIFGEAFFDFDPTPIAGLYTPRGVLHLPPPGDTYTPWLPVCVSLTPQTSGLPAV